MTDRNYLTRWLMQEEGLVLGGAKPDTEGYPTMGYGHKCGSFAERLLSRHMTGNDAVAILRHDIADAVLGFRHLFAGLEIDNSRTVALIALVFQLGAEGVRKFRKMRRAIAIEAWGVAKMELLFTDPEGSPGVQSRYYTQTPARAQRVGTILETGHLPELPG